MKFQTWQSHGGSAEPLRSCTGGGEQLDLSLSELQPAYYILTHWLHQGRQRLIWDQPPQGWWETQGVSLTTHLVCRYHRCLVLLCFSPFSPQCVCLLLYSLLFFSFFSNIMGATGREGIWAPEEIAQFAVTMVFIVKYKENKTTMTTDQYMLPQQQIVLSASLQENMTQAEQPLALLMCNPVVIITSFYACHALLRHNIHTL